jgi:hypothetical protein
MVSAFPLACFPCGHSLMAYYGSLKPLPNRRTANPGCWVYSGMLITSLKGVSVVGDSKASEAERLVKHLGRDSTLFK